MLFCYLESKDDGTGNDATEKQYMVFFKGRIAAHILTEFGLAFDQ